MWNKHHYSKLEIKPELKLLQDHLLQDCLCSLPENASPTILRRFFSSSVLRSDLADNWNVDQILTYIACIQLMCEKTLKQSANRFRCQTLADLYNDLIRQHDDVVRYLISLADDSDPYVRFVAARAIALLFVMLKRRLNPTWLNKLGKNLEHRSQPQQMLFSLDVLKRVLEWQDFEEHMLEDGPAEDEQQPPASPTCHLLAMQVERMDSSSAKEGCVQSLSSNWTKIVDQFRTGIRNGVAASSPYGVCVITFLCLWETLISVKANLSVNDTKPFYYALDKSFSLLASGTPPLVWKHLLGLFNEVLCYGSTLALQHDMPVEPCSLAPIVIRSVKDRRLLRLVPCGSGCGGSFAAGVIAGGDGSDKVLLKKTVLMVLKAVAVTAKLAKYSDSSSSDSSVGSEHEDPDLDIICRSIHDVLKKLDAFVKKKEDFHPETKLATWVVHLFLDQDDYLVEGMVCCVDLARALCYRNNFLPNLRKVLNPSETFLTFVTLTSFNTDLLVDYLKSNETCFLLYILNFLKYLREHWAEFVNTCRYELQAFSELFKELRSKIEQEVRIHRITYNINPVLSLLRDCELRFHLP